MTDEIKAGFSAIAPHTVFGEPMSEHTSFKIGGEADVFVEAGSAEELSALVKFSIENGVPYMIMGNGSNMLVSDSGIRGAVFRIGGAMNKLEINETRITAECGVLLSELAAAAAAAGLTGLEFASGIPGTLGGGLYMNAGAYGGELKDVVRSVTYMDENGELAEKTAEELDFGYRHSFFSDKKCAAVSCVIELERGEKERILARMKEFAAVRRQKQPLEYPSAGSTFKRPQGYFAGKLIQDAGMQGASVGGAQVSEKHAGFIINKGGATAADVAQLIELVRSEVKKQFGVELEPEVRVIERL